MNIPRHKYNPIDSSIVQRMRKVKAAKNITEFIQYAIRHETGVDPVANRQYRGEIVVTARYLFMVFMNKYTKETYVSITKKIGRDHSTLNHAIKKVSDYCETDKEYKAMYDRIETKIKSYLQ